MRKLVTILFMFGVLYAQHIEAASTPLHLTNNYFSTNKAIANKPSTISPSKSSATKKWNFIQRLEYKLLTHQLQKKFTRPADAAKKGSVLSTISLLAGLLGLAATFISGGVAIVIILSLAALITGIMALGKRNTTKGTRTKAIIGLILGVLLTVLGLLAIAIGGLLAGY